LPRYVVYRRGLNSYESKVYQAYTSSTSAWSTAILGRRRSSWHRISSRRARLSYGTDDTGILQEFRSKPDGWLTFFKDTIIERCICFIEEGPGGQNTTHFWHNRPRVQPHTTQERQQHTPTNRLLATSPLSYVYQTTPEQPSQTPQLGII
jgi:hypothetical protein